MSIKKFGVAAALMLCAVGASASNFTVADQVYIPVAGHLQGGSGTFISDVYLSNLTGDEVKVSVIYVPFGPNPDIGPNGPGLEFRDAVTLRPFERREFLDFFQSGLGLTSGFGQLIFSGCRSGASCGPETQDASGFSPNFRDISATSRIYQIANNAPANPPTTGQLFAGIPWYNFVSQEAPPGLDRVFITGIRQTGGIGQAGTFRTNIGVVNASQYSSTTIAVTLYQGTMDAAGRRGEALIQLGPLGQVQQPFNVMFPNAPAGGNYFVTVEQRNSAPAGPNVPQGCSIGCPAFLAYGSVLDNVSGDATTLQAQYMIALPQAAIDALYPGAAGKTAIRRAVRH